MLRSNFSPEEKLISEERILLCSFLADNSVQVKGKLSLTNNFDAESQVIAMKQMGIDLSLIYPTYGLWLLAVDTMTPQLAQEFVLAYNNWLRDFCSYDPEILRRVGIVNLHNPEDMVPELNRIAKFGWKSVCVLPNPVKGRLLLLAKA